MRPTQITLSEGGKNKAEKWVLLTLFDLLDPAILEVISELFSYVTRYIQFFFLSQFELDLCHLQLKSSCLLHIREV